MTDRNPGSRPSGERESIPAIQEVHFQTKVLGGIAELFAMIITGQRHTTAVFIRGFTVSQRRASAASWSIVVRRSSGHSNIPGWTGHFVEQMLLDPSPPIVPCEMAPACILEQTRLIKPPPAGLGLSPATESMPFQAML
jgi:hypothetical protein